MAPPRSLLMFPGLSPPRKRPRLLHPDKALPSGRTPLLTQAWPDGPKETGRSGCRVNRYAAGADPSANGTAPGKKSALSLTRDSLESWHRTIHWEGSGALGFSRLGKNSETNVPTASRTVSVTPQIEAKRCPHVGEGNSGDHNPSHSF